jgi:hypothetical protein
VSAKRRARRTENPAGRAVRFTSVPCPSGKFGYFTKAEAKTVARRLRKLGDNRLMNAYRCGQCGLIHIGHLPRVVMQGEVTRGEYFGGLTAGEPIYDEAPGCGDAA